MIIAETLGWDIRELSEYRYQPGRTKQSLYAIGQQYFAVSPKLPKDKDYAWMLHADQFSASKQNTKLWVADVDARAHEYACGCKVATTEPPVYYDHACANCFTEPRTKRARKTVNAKPEIDAEEELDNCFDMKCPKCGKSDQIDVSAQVYVRLTRFGSSQDEAECGDTEWDNDSVATCQACAYVATVKDFRID